MAGANRTSIEPSSTESRQRTADGAARSAAGGEAAFGARAFRCPFDVTGEAENTNLHMRLGADRGERLDSLRTGFTLLHQDRRLTAIKFILARELWEPACAGLVGRKALVALKPCLLPFQLEAAAANLAAVLDPYLPWQRAALAPLYAAQAAKSAEPEKVAADHLVAAFRSARGRDPSSMAALADWFAERFAAPDLRHREHPEFRIVAQTPQGPAPVLRITPGGMTLCSDHAVDKAWTPHHNRNPFSFVTTPFYPQTTGRYSAELVIAVTREADLLGLGDDVRRRIALRANEAYAACGYRVGGPLEQKPQGLWIPRTRV